MHALLEVGADFIIEPGTQVRNGLLQQPQLPGKPSAVPATRLPGPPVLRGAAWGVVLWLIAQTMVMPMMGGGLFSAAAGGMAAAVASLMGHLVYGAILGAVSGESELQPAHA